MSSCVLSVKAMGNAALWVDPVNYPVRVLLKLFKFETYIWSGSCEENDFVELTHL